MLYRLRFDPQLSDQWFLDTPVHETGDEWAFWRLLGGSERAETDRGIWQTTVKQPGKRLPFTFAGFDVPILDPVTTKLLAELAGADAQFPPVSVLGEPSSYSVLVATKTVSCVDESQSEFTKWTEADGRPDELGQYRMFTRLVLAASAVPSEVRLFRVAGWSQALVAREQLVRELRRFVKEGLIYARVA